MKAYDQLRRDGGSADLAKRLKGLQETEAELSQYKKMYAGLARENYALKDLIEKKL